MVPIIDSDTLDAVHDELSGLVHHGLDIAVLYQREMGVIDAAGDVVLRGEAPGLKLAHPVVVGRRLAPLWLLAAGVETSGLLGAVAATVGRLVTILEASLARS